MSKYLFSLSFLLVFIGEPQAQKVITHEAWTGLLQAYVDDFGKVNYKGLKSDEAKLDDYLKLLSENPASVKWDYEEQEAYWINAYNAFTIKLILEHYPVKSIMDIKEDGKDAWHIPFIKIGDQRYTLDYIENTMLRGQFNDSRIHFAINCSAKSCPPLKNKAYSANNLNIELRLAARLFINDKRFNILSSSHLQLSQIFNWYKDDFLKEESSLQNYINNNTPHIEVKPNATLGFIQYNWDLNEK